MKKEVCYIVKQILTDLMKKDIFTIENVDWHEVGKYLYVTQKREMLESLGVQSAIPERSVGDKARGRRPGPAYWDSDIIIDNSQGSGNTREERTRGKWIRRENPTKEQSANMMGQMIADAIDTAMSNHMYRFDGKVYLQNDGGPIGDELSQAIARLVMIWWDRKFLDKCSRLGIDMLMYMRYADDTNKVLIPPELGTRYDGEQLKVVEELVQEDSRKQRDELAANILQAIANSISPMIQFEVDFCSNYGDGKMPILDLKVWKEEGVDGETVIKHEFYKKPMASRLTLRGDTAYPVSQMRAIMVEEVLRRLRNCSPESPWVEKGRHLSEFAQSLKVSGHSERFRVTVFRKAIAKYEAELRRHMEGISDLYRTRSTREEQTKAKGGKSTKDTWFRKKKAGEKEETTSVLVVPYSGGELAKKLREKMKTCKEPEGIKTRIQEGGGIKLKDRLMKTDPFPRQRCFREDCPVVSRSGESCNETCFQGHATYEARCKECKRKRDEAVSSRVANDDIPDDCVYIGETSRGLYERHRTHDQKFRSRNGAGFMFRHSEEEHKDSKEVKYQMLRTATDRDPMRRVIRESVQIVKASRQSGKKLMNNKDEYFGVHIVKSNFTQEWLE